MKDTRDPLHAQEARPRLVIVVCGPDSVLPDVLAIHTIEMIPKSMILNLSVTSFILYMDFNNQLSVKYLSSYQEEIQIYVYP